MQLAADFPSLFVVGTDTGVGKTRVSGWIVQSLHERGYRPGVCKPASTGAEPGENGWIWPDLEHLRVACGSDFPLEKIGPFRWFAPLAPPAAQRIDRSDDRLLPIQKYARLPAINDYLDALFSWKDHCDLLIIEGTGGLLCPLTERETIADLAVAWGAPILIVSRLGLGTLNHTLLTVEAARRRGLKVVGVMLNRPGPETDGIAEQTNPTELRARLDIPVFGPLSFQTEMAPTPPEIRAIDWLNLRSNHC